MKLQTMIRKGTYICVITLLFLMILAHGMKERENRQLYFALESGTQTQKILPFAAEDGKTYVFLPSHSSFSRLRIYIPKGSSVSLGKRPVEDGMYCDGFQTGIPYALATGEEEPTQLVFMQSENIPSLHIHTASGNMARIHSDKEKDEEAAVWLYTADGALHFMDAGSRMSGRGNYTWEQEKKPYSLDLSYEGDLLGMGSSSEWILLANVADGSKLNNKLVLDLAEEFCPEWTPECEFVDLYLNGEYAGLYLLTERIETVREKLDLDLTAGEYLCRIDYPGRIEIIDNPITTQAGRVAYVSEPKRLSDTEKSRIGEEIQQLEDLILSGSDLSEVEWFDLDSWVRKYLIDEVSMNGDSDLASSYFYLKEDTFYAGPMWDYDVCFGNRDRTKDPGVFYAKNRYKSFHKSLYYSTLCTNPSFHSRVREIYAEDLLPLLEQMITTGISQQAQTIKASSEMDNIRWKVLYDLTFSSNLLFMTTPESIRDHLEKRLEFLSSAWIDGVNYCTIQFDAAETMILSIPEGHLPEIVDEKILDYLWADVETGEIFDPQQPVTKDLFLQVMWYPEFEETVTAEQIPEEAPEAVLPETMEQSQETAVPQQREVSTRAVVCLISLILMFGIFLCLAAKDRQNQSPKPRRREYSHE